MKKYVYPLLSFPKTDFGLFRLSGSGLANCLLVAARAYLRANDTGAEMLRPTWERLGIGQWLRGERDKRFYCGLFKREPLWKTIRKIFIFRFSTNVEIVDGLADYFEGLIPRHAEVKEWFDSSIEPSAIRVVPSEMRDSIAVHVRLGDFPESLRTPISWYCAVLDKVLLAIGKDVDIQIFSDGSDEELKDLLQVKGARRVFYGNALADIVAISRCGLLIAGMHSTFSAWGAFMGDVPSIFNDIDFGRVITSSELDCRARNPDAISDFFLMQLKERFS